MTEPDDSSRAELLARLADSRQELRRLLEPRSPENTRGAPAASGFPRSRTMRMLMSNRGLGTVGAAVAGILVARPLFALRLLRLLPSAPLPEPSWCAPWVRCARGASSRRLLVHPPDAEVQRRQQAYPGDERQHHPSRRGFDRGKFPQRPDQRQP